MRLWHKIKSNFSFENWFNNFCLLVAVKFFIKSDFFPNYEKDPELYFIFVIVPLVAFVFYEIGYGAAKLSSGEESQQMD